MFTPTSPVTGSAIIGLTSPTYTLTSDVSPSIFGKQFAVTALGGTQTGVNSHSISSPFTGTFTRASVLKQIQLNANGSIKNVPVNTHKLLIRKGLSCALNTVKNGSVEITLNLPAGSETYDQANVSALCSFAAGLLLQQIQGIRDTVTDGLV